MRQPTASTAVAPSGARRRGVYSLAIAYGHGVYRLRWLLLIGWAVALAVSVPFAAQIGSVLQGGYSYTGGESGQAAAILYHKLHQPPSQAIVVFQSAATAVSDRAYQAELSAVRAHLDGFPHLTGIMQGPVSADGRTTFLAVGFDLPDSAVSPDMPQFEDAVTSAARGGPATVTLTGAPVVDNAVLTISAQDASHAEALAMPLALIVLLFVFGTLISALMPLTLALGAVPVALAVIYAIASRYSTSSFVENMASIIGIGISIDYSLLMTRRFRDELANGRSVRDAVARTIATTGEAILCSGLCVIIGFVGLFFIGLDIITSMALGGMVIVGCAVLAALTLLPALLAVLGHRVDALRLPGLGHRGARTSQGRSQGRGRWHALALAVMDHPLLAIVGVTFIILYLSAPLTTIRLAWYGSGALPTGSEPAQGLAILKANFPQAVASPIEVVAQTPDGSDMLTADNLQHLAQLTTWLERQPHVTGAVGLLALPPGPGVPAVSPDELAQAFSSGAYQQYPQLRQLLAQTTNGDSTVIALTTNAPVDSDAGKALIGTLRAGDQAQGGGLRVLVGGVQAQSVDIINFTYGNFPRAILFTLLATFLLLLLLFRSLLLPLKAVLMNLLSLGATFGVLVFVFQWGNFEWLFGFTSEGFLDAIIPVMVFAVLFGLSMDYEIFLLSRIHEEWLRTRNNRNAVAYGLEKSGGVITSAAIVFIIVTLAFTLARVIQTKEMGLGLAVAVLVDASIVRTFLVPATMRLLGRWNWWFPGQPLPARSARVADPLDRAAYEAQVARPGITSGEAAALRQRYLRTALGHLLPGLSALVEAQVAAGAELADFAPGQVIIEQGAAPDRFYVITEGECDILRAAGTSGHEVLVDHLTSGEYFGEIGLLAGVPRTATVRAGADSAVATIALNRAAFEELIHGSGLAADDLAGVMRKRLLELQSLSDD